MNLLLDAAASLSVRLRRRLSSPAPRELHKVLVLGYGAIGDTIFFLPTLAALRLALPKARLVWASNPSPVFDELIPATGLVDELWAYDGASEVGRRQQAQFVARVRAADFDAAVLTLSAPAAWFQSALFDVPRISAHVCEGLSFKEGLVFGSLSRTALDASVETELGAEHSVRRNLRLLESLGLRASDPSMRPSLPIAEAARERAAKLLPEGPWVAVHLGPPTSYNFRAWSPERFGALSAELSCAWPGARFVLIGGPDEKPCAARALAAGPAGMKDLTGASSLLESFALLERCSLVLACDTGMAKAAMALGVSTATLWGPSSATESGIIWDPEWHLDLVSEINCAPCRHL